MNNQIDKLMVKAGAYFGGEGVDYSNFDPKKFAELIVRECIGVVQNIKPQFGDYRDQIETAQSAYCIGQIKRHFRVEEPELSASDKILQTVRKRS